MEDADGLSFDFEGGLDSGHPQPTASVSNLLSDSSAAAADASSSIFSGNSSDPSAAGGMGRGRSFRQTVCRHWLRSLCMKGDACGFLHQYDKSRMPICRFFRLYGKCHEQDCVYKHTHEDIKECNMYKLGFCPNGSGCRYRHAKLPGPPPPVEEVLQKIRQLTSYNYGQNRLHQHRNVVNQQSERTQTQGLNTINTATVQKCSTTEAANMLQQQPQSQLSKQQPSQNNFPNSQSSTLNQSSRAAHPLPQGITRYFIVKSCNRENLELSVQQGVWATQRSNEPKLNEASDSVENVILIFSVNRTRHFQGCAKMTSRIGVSLGGGNWKHVHGSAHYGRNFSVKWLKLCELSFHKTRHLRNPYNENLPVKISRDCQELEPSIGEQLASLLYLEPDSELMAIAKEAESKREEEKAKGLDLKNAVENPDIVPFQDNEEEEEEEESEDEDESLGGDQGRGMIWHQQMMVGRGVRPMPVIGGFTPGMMAPMGPGFGMPDLFGLPPRSFGPCGPSPPMPRMMFPGRPQPGVMYHPRGGVGIMMGPGRGPSAGGMECLRGARPPIFSSPPPFHNHNVNLGCKREPRATTSETCTDGLERADMRNHEQGSTVQESRFDTSKFGNEESESEDEAPRRSRHGEGKKKRRGGDASFSDI